MFFSMFRLYTVWPIRIDVRIFGFKECQWNDVRTAGRQIYINYEKSNLQLASVGLAQARPNNK